jgi:hypothetical protein
MHDTYTQDDGNPKSKSISGQLMDVSAEQKIITNMSFSFLTAEAKFVLYAIYQTPGELSELIFRNKITPYKIKKYLTLMGWKIPTIVKTLRELRIFSKDLMTE